MCKGGLNNNQQCLSTTRIYSFYAASTLVVKHHIIIILQNITHSHVTDSCTPIISHPLLHRHCGVSPLVICEHAHRFCIKTAWAACAPQLLCHCLCSFIYLVLWSEFKTLWIELVEALNGLGSYYSATLVAAYSVVSGRSTITLHTLPAGELHFSSMY